MDNLDAILQEVMPLKIVESNHHCSFSVEISRAFLSGWYKRYTFHGGCCQVCVFYSCTNARPCNMFLNNVLTNPLHNTLHRRQAKRH